MPVKKKKKPAPKAKKTKKAKPAKPKKKAAPKAKSVSKSKPAKAAKKPKKSAKKKQKKPVVPEVVGTLLGKVEDYYAKIGVVALTLKAPVAVGDQIRIKGHTTDITLRLDSMQIEHAFVTQAVKGDAVGFKVPERARRRDRVYKI